MRTTKAYTQHAPVSRREIALVVGMSGSTGLAVVRALAQAGVECHAVHYQVGAAAMATRLARVHVVPDWRAEPETLAEALAALAGRLGLDAERRASVHACHDAALQPLWAASQRLVSAGLRPAYAFSRPPAEIVDKREQVSVAARVGIATPWSRWGSPRELEDLAAECPYPVIIKPALSHRGVQRMGAKALRCLDESELRAALARIGDLDVLLQELVPGGDDQLYTAGLFVCDDGHLAFTGRKLKQHPPGLGISRLSEEVDEPGMVPESVALLRELGYQGVAQVEFKRDARDGTLRLMEANFRAWTWIGLATTCGVNLPYGAHRWALDGKMPTLRPAGRRVGGTPRRWVWAMPEAIYTARDLRRGVRPRLSQWRGIRAEAFLSRRDPAPFLHAMAGGLGPRLHSLSLWMRRLLRGPAFVLNGIVQYAEWARAGRQTALGRPPALGLPTSGSTLVLAPHPDDETIMCGATIAALRQRGDAVRVVAVSAGAATAIGAAGEGSVAGERIAEMQAACAAMGVGDMAAWNLPDRRLPEQREALAERIAAELRSYRPGTVIAPFLCDAHPDHVAVAAALADALERVKAEAIMPAVFAGAVQTPASPGWVTRLVPVASTWKEREAAAACYLSRQPSVFVKSRQLSLLHPARPLRRAEGFVELDAAAWVALSRALAAEGLTSLGRRAAAHPVTIALELIQTRQARARISSLIQQTASQSGTAGARDED